MTCRQRNAPWTREQIQAARRASLPELLNTRGLHLQATAAENYRIREHPGIVVKRSFWSDTDSDRAGNAIDFFIYVLGMSFNQAMEEITRK